MASQSDVELLPDDILVRAHQHGEEHRESTVQTAISAVTSAFIYRGF